MEAPTSYRIAASHGLWALMALKRTLLANMLDEMQGSHKTWAPHTAC
jgi:hypothetical protein